MNRGYQDVSCLVTLVPYLELAVAAQLWVAEEEGRAGL